MNEMKWAVNQKRFQELEFLVQQGQGQEPVTTLMAISQETV